jgi:Flp pilus assembly protein TadB
MKREDENISRLMKIAKDSNKPGKAFFESLINNAIGELGRLKIANKQVISNAGRWENNMGWAAMVAAGCGAVLAVVASTLLKINFLLEAAIILTMSFNWLTYLGEHTL